jgi:hydroxypyruvate isomerase
VEIQFPYATGIADLMRARHEADVEVALLNIPAGNLAAGDVGLTCLPDRQAEYRRAVETCLTYASALGVKRINSLAGRPVPGETAEATRTLVDNLRHAADRFAEIGATVLIEPTNPTDVPGFLFNRLELALEAVQIIDRENVRLLFDFYHMTQTEPSLSDAIRQAGSLIGHVQFADVPGRHQPGTGTVDFAAALSALIEVGYTGSVSAEYRPTGPTTDSLAWMDDFRKWMT